MAIGDLLLLPLMAPVWGCRWVLESLRDEADAVLHDEGRVFAELIELSQRRNAGQLSESDFAEQEAELLARLSSIRDEQDEAVPSGDDLDDDGVFFSEDHVVEGDWLDTEPEALGEAR